MADIDGKRLREIVLEIEQIDRDRQYLAEQKKELLAKARAEGFDTNALRQILHHRFYKLKTPYPTGSAATDYQEAMDAAGP